MVGEAAMLEVHIVVVRAAYAGAPEDRVARGRKRHLVQVRMDFQPAPVGAGTLCRRRLPVNCAAEMMLRYLTICSRTRTSA
jgi:hypothetical protein